MKKNKNKIVIVVSAILRNKEGKVLLLKRSAKNKSNKGKWQLPEGKMEFGETPEQVMAREVLEETSLRVKNSKLLTVLAQSLKVNNTNYHAVRIIFEAQWYGNIVLSEDHNNFKWLSTGEISHLTTIVGTKKIFKTLSRR